MWFPRQGAAKYGKLAYSSAFAFSLDADDPAFADVGDSMLVLRDGAGDRRVRSAVTESGVDGEDEVWARWHPFPDVEIVTVLCPATIARWRAVVTGTPSGQLLIGTLIREWRKQDTCAPLGYATASYDFLWHGIVIEAVSLLPAGDEEYMISSGGLPDPRTYFAPLLVQP